MLRPVGIDLGTTTSAVAVMEAGRPVVVPNAEGSPATPSVVAFAKDGEVLVGEAAKRQAVTNARRTVSSVKRHLGEPGWKVDIGGGRYTAQEITARIVQKLVRDTESHLGTAVTQVVATVPAYFDDVQRTATKEAVEIAGLEVLRIINEATAAALAYGFGGPEVDETVLVFDLGGGTFDVSILEIGDGVFEVKASHGDTRLGGDDWDLRIVAWLVMQFKATSGVDLSTDATAMQRLKEAAEKAKIDLSELQETQINLPYITANADGPLHLVETLSRPTFQQLTVDLLRRCRRPVEHAISDAGITPGKIDQVILVGGSTRMPAVRDLVRELTGKEPRPGVRPDEAVALGAALQAGVLVGEVTDMLFLDVIPLSLGIETKGGVMTKVIERNTSIPTRRTEVFTTAEDNQASVEVHVLQGEREIAQDNRSLGKFELGGLPPAARGVPEIEVSFDIDANGLLHVSARDRATGGEHSVTITGGSALSGAEVERMRRRADQDRPPRPEPAAPVQQQDPRGQPQMPPQARTQPPQPETQMPAQQGQQPPPVPQPQPQAPGRTQTAEPTQPSGQPQTSGGTQPSGQPQAPGRAQTAEPTLPSGQAQAAGATQAPGEAAGEGRPDGPSSAGVFISYRRDDTAGFAGRLSDRLSGDLPGAPVFMDVDSVEPGTDFVRAIEEAIASCRVLLVLIGERWATAPGGAGRTRLHDEHDYVRLEIESAFASDVRVIPVVVEDAMMPRPSDLPDSLSRLARLQAVRLSHEGFRREYPVLVDVLRRLVS